MQQVYNGMAGRPWLFIVPYLSAESHYYNCSLAPDSGARLLQLCCNFSEVLKWAGQLGIDV